MHSLPATARQFDDGREVWYAGQRVATLAEPPVLGRCMANRAGELALHDDPASRPLFWVETEAAEHLCVVPPPPQSSAELVRYRQALEVALDRVGGGVAD